jgi:hypothetical protein
MSLELDPPQPEPVEQAIERLLGVKEPAVDPWWAAGLEESLGRDDRAAPQDAWSGPGVIEP